MATNPSYTDYMTKAHPNLRLVGEGNPRLRVKATPGVPSNLRIVDDGWVTYGVNVEGVGVVDAKDPNLNLPLDLQQILAEPEPPKRKPGRPPKAK